MASTGDVAAQVRAACKKAEEARTALEQAEDLAEEAHDMLAWALDGSSRLESDVAAMLARFGNVKDGLKGYLWPLITEVLRAAESIVARMEGDGTASPAHASQRPALPPQQPPSQQSPVTPTVRHAEPTDPPVVPPERIEQLRRELPSPVVPGAGQKTRGQWIGPDGAAHPVVSGRDNDADEADARLRDIGMPRKSAKTGDVEIKLAMRMVREGIRHAVVLINNEPCVGPFGCDTLVPILLPEGATLTVYGTTEQGEHIHTQYTGGARPWWR